MKRDRLSRDGWAVGRHDDPEALSSPALSSPALSRSAFQAGIATIGILVSRWFAPDGIGEIDAHVLEDAGLQWAGASPARRRRARLGASGVEMRGLPL